MHHYHHHDYQLSIANVNQIKSPTFYHISDPFDSVLLVTQKEVHHAQLFKKTQSQLALAQEVLDIYFVDSKTVLVLSMQGGSIQIRLCELAELKVIVEHCFARKSELGRKYVKSKLFAQSPSQMTLYLLDKKQMQQSEGIQNLYELKIFSISHQTILNIKTVDFTATVRLFYHQPLSDNQCLLYNPNHLTTKQFQFLLWDDSQLESESKIQVKQTKNQLKGTVVNVFSYLDNEQVTAIILYNSNGVTAPFIMYYNVKNQDEKHFQLKQEHSYIMLESQIQNDKIYILCSEISNKFILEFDLNQNSITSRIDDCLSNLILLPQSLIGTYEKQHVRVSMPVNYRGIEQLHLMKHVLKEDNDILNEILKMLQ